MIAAPDTEEVAHLLQDQEVELEGGETANDAGRTHLSWLLTSHPEPNYALTQKNKMRTGVVPFTRLGQPSWISANVAYLKDLDFIEGRIKATGQTSSPTPATKEVSEDPKSRKPWKKKKGKDEAGSTTAS